MMLAITVLLILCNLIVTTYGSAAPLLYLNQLYQFDGTSAKFVDLSKMLIAVKGNNPRTIKFQMKTTMPNGDGVAIVATGASDPVLSLFDICMYNQYIYVWSYGADIYFNSGPVLNDGQWHSVSVTYDGAGTVTLYVDHAFVKAFTSYTSTWDYVPKSPIKYNTIGDNNWLGKPQFNWGRNFVGSLQNIVFYDYAQSASEAVSDIVPTTSPTAAPTVSLAPSTLAPTIAPSTATPSFSPSVSSTSVVIPDLPRLPTCPEGWTLHATCQWTYGGKRLYQEASPVSTPAEDRYQFSAASAIAGLLIGIMLMRLFDYYNLFKEYGRRKEYMPIHESG